MSLDSTMWIAQVNVLYMASLMTIIVIIANAWLALQGVCSHCAMLEMYVRAPDMCPSLSLRLSHLCMLAVVLVADDVIHALHRTCV